MIDRGIDNRYRGGQAYRQADMIDRGIDKRYTAEEDRHIDRRKCRKGNRQEI
jgi:hypothetical protein